MILLIGNYIYDQQESMLRFANLLFHGLREHQESVELLMPRPIAGRLKPASTGLGKWLGYIDKFLFFPVQLRSRLSILRKRGRVVVHICDHSNAHYTWHLQGVPHLVTCNDVLAIRSAHGMFHENATAWTGRQYQRLILNGLRKAQHIACISSTTQEQLLELGGISESGTSVIEMGLNYPYAPMDPREAVERVARVLGQAGSEALVGRDFLFHVGGNQWYKNRDGLVKIYGEVANRIPNPPALLLAGEPLRDGIVESAALGEAGRLVELGKLENEDLRACYSIARALVFPSKYEGFGWPIVEAQACGCPVATSNRPPMNQIGGDAALYFDPDDTGSAAQSICDILSESLEGRAKRIAGGLKNAEQFSAERMLSRYVALYRTLN